MTIDVDALEQRRLDIAHCESAMGMAATCEECAWEELVETAITALRQQQEALKEIAIDLDNVGQKRKYFLHQCREKDAEIARLREAIEKAHYCLVQAIPHKLRITNTLFELEQALEPTKGSE